MRYHLVEFGPTDSRQHLCLICCEDDTEFAGVTPGGGVIGLHRACLPKLREAIVSDREHGAEWQGAS
jgi:hypothetical protein